MNEQSDPLNSVLLDARRQLQSIQDTLRQPDAEYTKVLSQLSETTTRLKIDAENIIDNHGTESSLIPLTARKQKKTVITKPDNTTPREHRPYQINKATKLRQQYIPRQQAKKNLPRLSSKQKHLNAQELMARGIVREYDDLSDIVPHVSTVGEAISTQLYPNFQIDIKGAAESIAIRKQKEKEKVRHFEKTYDALYEKPVQPITELVPEEEEVNEIPPEKVEKPVEDDKKHPRIYEEIQDEYAQQTLLVVRGKIARDTPDFESFKRTNHRKWNRIDAVLHKIEEYCEKFEIQFAEINGRKLSEAATFRIVTDDDVKMCLIGIDALVEKKQDHAARIIQKNWRIKLEKLNVVKRKNLFWAAYEIQLFWKRVKDKENLMDEIHNRLDAMEEKAADLSKSLSGKYSEIESFEYIIVHVVASPQDLSRCFDLIQRNAHIILLMSALPSNHIWEQFNDMMAQCGIPDLNSRVNFIVLKDGEGLSQRIFSDMKSVQQIRKLICGRNAFLVPHSDWSPEVRLSVDINLPILGCTDTTYFQSRAAIRGTFTEAGIVSPFSTNEHRNIQFLIQDVVELMYNNPDFSKWIIRLGFSSSDSSIATFTSNDEFLQTNDMLTLLKSQLHVTGGSVSSFLSQIKDVGATIEAIPESIHSFPSVSLLLTGNEMRVIGTFDRCHYAPFRFSANVIPAVSVDGQELIAMAKQTASVLLKKGVIGYVIIDFLAFKEDDVMRLIGFDIRINAYPHALMTAYMSLCCGFDSNTNKMVLLRSIDAQTQKKCRYAVVHSGMKHPALSLLGAKEIKRLCYSQGLLFDLLARTGFRIEFFDSPSEGKGFSIDSEQSIEIAISRFEKAYSYLLRYLSQKIGSETNSSIAHALICLRHFRSRVLS